MDSKSRRQQRAEHGFSTNDQLGQDIAGQVSYILSALGLMDRFDGADAIRSAVKGARKADLWGVLDVLRQIKTAVRADREALKAYDNGEAARAREQLQAVASSALSTYDEREAAKADASKEAAIRVEVKKYGAHGARRRADAAARAADKADAERDRKARLARKVDADDRQRADERSKNPAWFTKRLEADRAKATRQRDRRRSKARKAFEILDSLKAPEDTEN
jgi:hypothetical protein